MNKKYYCSACSPYHGNWLEPLGYELAGDLKDADVVIFGGGADIEPSTYGEEHASGTYTSPGREKTERKDFTEALKLGKKIVGICRGHQLIAALNGAKLIQHVTGHSGDHEIATFDGVHTYTNSIHHQMINPSMLNPKDYRVLAWTPKRLSRKYVGAKDKAVLLPVDFKEIEAIYFPKTNSIGFQYHPEMMYPSGRAIMGWTQKIFTNFMENKL